MSVYISVYIMYTVRNRRHTDRCVEGVYTESYSCGRVPSSSGHMSVYSVYTWRIKGYTECGVEGMCTDFVYLVDNDPWFLARMEIDYGLLVAGHLGIQISDLKTLHKQTPFLSFPSALFFSTFTN